MIRGNIEIIIYNCVEFRQRGFIDVRGLPPRREHDIQQSIGNPRVRFATQMAVQTAFTIEGTTMLNKDTLHVPVPAELGFKLGVLIRTGNLPVKVTALLD